MLIAPIELIAVLPEHKAALAAGRPLLAALLGLDVPDQWPEFPEAFDPESPVPNSPDWPAYFFASSKLRTIVGNGGYCGPPQEGEVEIGYEIAPAFRNRGFATAAAELLIAAAFATSSIEAVIANTLAERNASNAVLVKVGMTFVGEFPNPEVGKIWRWRRVRTSVM
jgi:RimJ/RimL family protein N-acetyltransferase